MTAKIGAYLSIYNDWDILPAALRSIAGHVDELVVLDGAYEWMAPYVAKIGLDPLRSDDRVLDAIASSGIPVRYVSRLWKNEVEKRLAGYGSCESRYVYRIDADEVSFFDDAVLERFLNAGAAVAEMDMPLYMAPGWVAAPRPPAQMSRQGFLFDRTQVTPELHLNYLWLVLTADALPSAGQHPFQVFPDPIAFNAHLSEWRRWETAVTRAAFYILNYIRGYGVPWIPELRDKPVRDFGRFFDLMPPHQFLETLLNDRVIVGNLELRPDLALLPSPLDSRQEAVLLPVFERFLAGHAELNASLARQSRRFIPGALISLEITSPIACEAIERNGTIEIEVSEEVAACAARERRLLSSDPWHQVETLSHAVEGRRVLIDLPPAGRQDSPVLRRVLEFQLWVATSTLSPAFRIFGEDAVGE